MLSFRLHSIDLNNHTVREKRDFFRVWFQIQRNDLSVNAKYNNSSSNIQLNT